MHWQYQQCNIKNLVNLILKKFILLGILEQQLKTVEDIMLTGNKIPFVKENLNMKVQ